MACTASGWVASTRHRARSEAEVEALVEGRDFIANPDLPERIRHGRPLNAYDRDTFYGGTEVGFTDYPFYQATA